MQNGVGRVDRKVDRKKKLNVGGVRRVEEEI